MPKEHLEGGPEEILRLGVNNNVQVGFLQVYRHGPIPCPELWQDH